MSKRQSTLLGFVKKRRVEILQNEGVSDAAIANDVMDVPAPEPKKYWMLMQRMLAFLYNPIFILMMI